MVLALGVARDLGANHTQRVVLRRSTPNTSETMLIGALDIERAGTRAIVRTYAGDDVERQGLAPA